jgi:NADH dehydrogenase
MEAVWSIGDCAAAPDPRGGQAPPTAQHAVREGPVVARNIAAELGIGRPEAFGYRGNASFVNLGRYKAVGRVGNRTFRGFPAWWMARTYHMSQIPGAARKARAIIDWTASLPFRRDLSEVGSIGHPKRLGETMEPWASSTSSSHSSSG